jgi:hypothetical protein
MFNISSLGSTECPDEVIFNCLSDFPPSEVYKSRLVCKKWHRLSEKNEVWIHLYNQLNPCNADKFSGNLKNKVIFDLQKNQKEVHKIVSLISHDKIAALFGVASLRQLKQMPQSDRSFYIMSRVRNDCTELYKGVRDYFENYIKEKIPNNKYDRKPIQLLELLKMAEHDRGFRIKREYRYTLEINIVWINFQVFEYQTSVKDFKFLCNKFYKSDRSNDVNSQEKLYPLLKTAPAKMGDNG